ncbi:hypothetical protein BAE44_0013212, partial [Dichanthelium oligosanthes]
LMMSVAREISEERNARVFQRKYKSVSSLLAKIKDEVQAWCIAGAKDLAELLPHL